MIDLQREILGRLLSDFQFSMQGGMLLAVKKNLW